MIDKGAHFNCCDFQVHTPRDPSWTGPRPVSTKDRLKYGQRFISACREKGLDAVAITDHHDMVMADFIRRAAKDETYRNGDEVPEENQIKIFPGIELTLNIPCQALLIFDSDFPSGLFTLALDALAIPRPDESKKEAEPPDSIEDVKSFDDLYAHLDRHEALRGRYIVLPHVKPSGHQTLLRRGNHKKYAKMPCVGGYVDGSIQCFSEGDQQKIDGRDKNWGNKRIAVFQSSDSRTSDHANLGKYSSWVKWAKPTAEAIRQACLAPESRILHEKPVLPQTIIRSIRVSNSSFMSRVDLFLNPQYNALIGGRGTGKSTILEYLRWAVADQYPSASEEGDTPNYKVRSHKLIEGTLKPQDGVVDVEFEVNGIFHTVRRNSSTNQIMLKIADKEFEPCTEKDIRTLLPIQAYSQKQLSNVGVRLDELGLFVESPIRDKLDEIDQSFDHLASEIRQQYSKVEHKRTIERSFSVDTLSLKSLKQQTESIRKSITGLSEDDQNCLNIRAYYDDILHTIENWQKEIEEASQGIEELNEALVDIPSKSEVASKGQETELIAELNEHITDLFSTVQSHVEDAGNAISEFEKPKSAFRKILKKLENNVSDFDKKYDSAKKRSSAHESKLVELKALEERQRVLRKAISRYKSELGTIGSPEQQYERLRKKWVEQHKFRTRILEEECLRLTERSGDDIRAGLNLAAGLAGVVEKLRKSLSGSGLRKQKFESLLADIQAEEDRIAAWEEVLSELEVLASSASGEEVELSLPDTPILRKYGFSKDDSEKIRSKLNIESWIELALSTAQDQPNFEFRKREGEYIPFDAASAGQQATALLKALLNQPGPPLIIDQPEDDLDNPVILDVVEQIWIAKSRRQLIFASHNANLVVNGDAELVIWCDHIVAGDRSGGKIKSEGAIDVPQICDGIKNVMEGGEHAFKLRRDKYGF